jgi:CrcB protein
VVGSLILGFLLEVLAGRRDRLRLLLGTGLCGGFTTYSALALELERLVASGSWAVAGGYLAATLVLGTVAAVAGVALGGLARGRA